MLELTRRMTLSRNCFVRTAGAYIDDEGYIDNTFNVSFKNMSKHDQQVNLDLAKTIPFSKTNEQLKCYKFPEGDMAYDSGGNLQYKRFIKWNKPSAGTGVWNLYLSWNI